MGIPEYLFHVFCLVAELGVASRNDNQPALGMQKRQEFLYKIDRGLEVGLHVGLR